MRISETSDSDLGCTVESIHWRRVIFRPNSLFFIQKRKEHIPSSPMTPIQYFYLFFTTSLLNSIVTQTNNYARNFLHSQKNISPHSRILKWTDVTVTELKVFIAYLLNMGIKRQPTISSYWSVSPNLNNPWFRSMFSRNRFQLILKFFIWWIKRTWQGLDNPNMTLAQNFNHSLTTPMHFSGTIMYRWYIVHLCCFTSAK